jgi:UDP-2,3-diacylglucosamine pyrophosphatase LpxH
VALRVTRTLVISDLHLGGRFFGGVLTRPEPLRRLLCAVGGIDRLVLLGDTVELAERRPGRSMSIAEPVLRALGSALGPRREVVLVAGNHDHALVRDWVRAAGDRLGVATPVPLDASPQLARLASWLAPAQVSASYPGTWLEERVFATHGHYLDMHLRPVSSYGVRRRRRASQLPDPATPADYELAGRTLRQSRIEAMQRGFMSSPSGLLGLLRYTLTRQLKARVLRPWLAPLTASMLNAQMLHAGMPGLSQVAENLRIDADTVIFGHVHRLGPVGGDAPGLWRAATGARLLNTGSWLWEPLLVHRARPPHPYWPGGAVLLEPGRPARTVGLLDDLGPDALRPSER